MALEAHCEEVVLDLLLVVEVLHDGRLAGAHSHDAVGGLLDEEASLGVLAAEHEIYGVPVGEVLVGLVVVRPAHPELVDGLVRLPGGALRVGLGELALVVMAVACEGDAGGSELEQM